MAGLSDALAAAASGMQAQSGRLRYTAENIANADTPGYRRKTTSFEQVMAAGRTTGEVRSGPLQLDQTPLTRIYDPAHPLAGADGFYGGSNVQLLTEVADAREASRSYEANLRMFDQARKLSSQLWDLLRR